MWGDSVRSLSRSGREGSIWKETFLEQPVTPDLPYRIDCCSVSLNHLCFVAASSSSSSFLPLLSSSSLSSPFFLVLLFFLFLSLFLLKISHGIVLTTQSLRTLEPSKHLAQTWRSEFMCLVWSPMTCAIKTSLEDFYIKKYYLKFLLWRLKVCTQFALMKWCPCRKWPNENEKISHLNAKERQLANATQYVTAVKTDEMLKWDTSVGAVTSSLGPVSFLK